MLEQFKKLNKKEKTFIILAILYIIGIGYFNYISSKETEDLQFQFTCDYCKQEVDL
jgi:Tfp pilus assembly protein PilO